MEKYFIVTEQSKLFKDYWNYIKNRKLINEYVKEFMSKHDIETSEYAVTEEHFYIIPTKKDIEKFNRILCNPIHDGLRAFKKNSKIGKEWIKLLDEKNIEILYRPCVPFYFNCYGKTRSRLFHIGDKIYCSLEIESGEIECPNGMIEIKASEFYKVIEDNSR